MTPSLFKLACQKGAELARKDVKELQGKAEGASKRIFQAAVFLDYLAQGMEEASKLDQHNEETDLSPEQRKAFLKQYGLEDDPV